MISLITSHHNEISLQDLEQQLLLELRDPVGTMAVHRQLVEEGRAKLL